jgi:hypothetical protein
MGKTTLDGLERGIQAVAADLHRIEAWLQRHESRDDERFEHEASKREEDRGSVSEIKQMLGEALSLDGRLERVEKSQLEQSKAIDKLERTGDRNQPWMEILKSLLKNLIYAVIGGAAYALWELLRK